jgi:hypothetical protein
MDDLRDEFIAETRETLEILSSQLVHGKKRLRTRADRFRVSLCAHGKG